MITELMIIFVRDLFLEGYGQQKPMLLIRVY